MTEEKINELLNKGVAEQDKRNLDKALEYYKEGLELAKNLNDKGLISLSYYDVSAIYLENCIIY